ncbi:hypothetical protein FPQ18DRAFT_311082 [Pyronema domesticum]|uniref:Uncharacterized protein n=1 Tax=Pyronema omphalodes (strain CBS 100304) TaxID=1076935 RepID=U4LM68_PYROM|nr:hypothetical protein FPQ18DRAFT_311082 [Pyronema domesticum]CCX33033.1 Protein of unknown function [Pyronema omphalodes CBS 100304]
MLRLNYFCLIALAISAQVTAMPCDDNEEPVLNPGAIFDKPPNPELAIHYPGESHDTNEEHDHTHPDVVYENLNPIDSEISGPSPGENPADYWEHDHINPGAIFFKPPNPELAIHYPGENNDKGEIIWERSLSNQDPGIEATIPTGSEDDDTMYLNGAAMYDEPLHPADKHLQEHPNDHSNVVSKGNPGFEFNEDILMKRVDAGNQGISKRGYNEYLYFYTHFKCWKNFHAPFKSVHMIAYYLQSKGKRWCCSGAKGECIVHARYQGTYAFWCSASQLPRCITCDKMGELLFRMANQCYKEGNLAGKATLGGIGDLTVVRV